MNATSQTLHYFDATRGSRTAKVSTRARWGRL